MALVRIQHRAAPATANHVPQRWEVADALARAALVVTPDDRGGIARQASDNSLWALLSHSPVTWAMLAPIDIQQWLSDHSHPTGYTPGADEYWVLYDPPDVTAPVVTAFTMPATSDSLTVAISTFTATDAVGVTGYKVTESATPPGSGADGWTVSAPTSVTASTGGAVSFYPWAKDAAGNVSAVATPATVTITTPVSTPTFSPAAGTYTNDQSVAISCATAGATIHYTTDGTNPTTGSPTYSAPIAVAALTEIRALAVKAGMANSPIASASYALQCASPTFSPGAGTYDVAQTVTLATATTGAAIRYTTEGSDPTGTSTLYSAPISVSPGTTVRAVAMKSGYTNSAFASAAYAARPTVMADTFESYALFSGTAPSAAMVSAGWASAYTDGIVAVVDGTTVGTTGKALQISDNSASGGCGVKRTFAATQLYSARIKARAGQTNVNGVVVRIVSDVDTGAMVFGLRFRADGFIKYETSDANTVANFSTPFAYSANTWYSIELLNWNWSTRKVDVYIDGALIQAAVPLVPDGPSRTPAGIFMVNATDLAAEVGDWWYDDLSFS